MTSVSQISRSHRLVQWGCWFCLAVLLAVAGVWSTMAILYSNLPAAWLRALSAVLFVVAFSVVLWRVRPWWVATATNLAAGGLVLAWFLLIPPSNDRDWQPDVAVLPYADIQESNVTLHNIRNCAYRTETDYQVRHYDKTFNLNQIRTADLYMVYWGSPYMAHTMVSFGFEGGDYVCFSIETRKEKGEGYSAIKGMFRQFELIYIVGDERDLVRLRTNYRQGEEAYLYRLHESAERVRTLFLDYLRRVNDLHRRPEWYNAITQNCTTGIRTQRAAADRAAWDWRMLVNGYGDELLYERGAISTNLSLVELKQRCHINGRARAVNLAADFSQQIRDGVP